MPPDGQQAAIARPEPASKAVRLAAGLVGCVALAISALLFHERGLVGFPDGFVTDHDRMRKTVLAAASAASLLTGGWFAFLGWTGPQRTGKKLGLTSLAYGVLVALALMADQHLRERSGVGG